MSIKSASVPVSYVNFTDVFNPLMPGGNKKVTRAQTNLQLSATGLFKYR